MKKIDPNLAVLAGGVTVLCLLVVTIAGLSTLGSTPKKVVKDAKQKIEAPPIEYLDSRQPQIKLLLQNSQVLEHSLSHVESNLRLMIQAQAKDCGEPNGFHDQGKVIICYELLAETIKQFQSVGLKPTEAVENALRVIVFTFLHETGHAVIRQHNLPYTGSEEIAADEFAMVYALRKMPTGEMVIKSGILAETLSTATSKTNSEHLVGRQRGNYLLCRLYGMKPGQRDLATGVGFDGENLRECQAIGKRTLGVWKELLRKVEK